MSIIPICLSWNAIYFVSHNGVSGSKFLTRFLRTLYVSVTQSLPLYLSLTFNWLGLGIFVIFALVVLAVARFSVKLISWKQKTSSSRRLIGIFHPHCDQRAGGEMVLWSLIKYILSLESLANAEIIVYTNALPKHFASSGLILKEKPKPHSNDMIKRENSLRKHSTVKSSSRSNDELFNPLSLEKNISKAVEEGNFESFHASRILDDASRVFGLEAFADMSKPENVLMRSRVKFHFLKHSDMTDPNHYPRLTLLLQFLAASISVCEIISNFLHVVLTTKSDLHRLSFKLVISYFGFSKDAKKSPVIPAKLSSHPPLLPDVIIDTAGYPFVLPLFKALSFSTAAYVHYPIITYAMVDRVRQLNSSAALPSENSKKRLILNQAKIVYYRAFRLLYALAGWGVDLVLCNSSWTKNQLSQVWAVPSSTLRTVFPPCKLVGKEVGKEVDTTSLLDSDDMNRKPHFLSLGQFRPEKDHVLQLMSFALALQRLRRTRTIDGEDILLRMIGTTRPQDLARIEALKVLAQELGIASQVEFYFDLPFPILREKLAEGYFGVHTMLDEHFGIGVVELAEAGLVTIAHNSAGPQLDIIVPSIVYNKEKGGYAISVAGIELNKEELPNFEHGAVGLLASDVETYAQMMLLAISMYEEEKISFRHPLGGSNNEENEENEESIKMPKLPQICRLGAQENECATQSMRRQARDRMRSHFSIEAFQKSIDSTLVPLLFESFRTKIE